MCFLKKEKRTRELSGGMRQYKRKSLAKKKSRIWGGEIQQRERWQR